MIDTYGRAQQGSLSGKSLSDLPDKIISAARAARRTIDQEKTNR
jgi:hypothetical protein